MKDVTSISNDEAIIEALRADPELAAEYLKAAMEDREEPKVLLLALRHLAEANGGIAAVAKRAGVERESLYRALSARGNPRLSTLFAVTQAMGLSLTVDAVNAKPRAKRGAANRRRAAGKRSQSGPSLRPSAKAPSR